MIDLLLRDFCTPVGLNLNGELFYRFNLKLLALPKEEHRKAINSDIVLVLTVFEGKIDSVHVWHYSQDEAVMINRDIPESLESVLKLIYEVAVKASSQLT